MTTEKPDAPSDEDRYDDYDDYDDDNYDEDDEYYDDEDEDEDYRPLRSRRRVWAAIAASVLVLLGLSLGLGLSLTGGSGGPSGPEGVPLQNVPDLASPNTTATGATVDGLTCRKSMAATDPYHVHAHLNIFVDGRQMRVPAGVGITQPRETAQLPGGPFVDAGTSDCLYWLHVHANDGIIHIEAPARQNFTLGQFFDVWRQPLGPGQVGPAKGTVVAYENGKRFTGNPRNIPLLSQAVIQIDVGSPAVPFKPMKFKVVGGLCATSCTPISSS